MKYRILNLLFNSRRYLSPEEIAENLGVNLISTKSHLSRLCKWYHTPKKSKLEQIGYIWRRREWRVGRKNKYCYRFLKPKGLKIYFKLDERVRIRTMTGIFVSLNLNKPIPEEVIMKYHEAKQ